MNTILTNIRNLYLRGISVLTSTQDAPARARYTVRYHLPAEVLIGLFSGVLMLADLVTRKTLGAPEWMLALQTSVPMMALTLAMVWRDLLEARDRRLVLLITGIFGKGVLVAVAFVKSPGPLLGIVIVLAVADSAFIPLRNAIFRANYDEKIRGRVFGGVLSLMIVAVIFANLLAAWLLERWEWTYRIVFPVAGVLGFGAHLVYARIRVYGEKTVPTAPLEPMLRRAAGSLGRAFRTTVRILREDRDFRAYEGNFFLYGLAFLMNLPLVVLLIVDELDLPYDQAAWSRFAIAQVAMILLAPVAGRFLDKTHPARLMALGGGLLAVHAALLALTHDVWMLFTSYAVFGVAMTSVILAWNLGPVHFARSERESTDYMAVHVTLTGLRAILAPAIALLAKGLFGLRAGFAVSAGLYAVSAILMLRLARRCAPRPPRSSGSGEPEGEPLPSGEPAGGS